MDLGIAGRSALVTGASRGIGAIIAERLAQEGCRVALVARDQERLLRHVERIGGRAAGHQALACDLMADGAIDAVLRWLEASFGTPEILVHNLGGNLGLRDPLCRVEAWRQLWRFNLEIAIELNARLVPAMQASGWGRILHISSVSGVENLGPVPYGTVKAALIAYVRCLGRVLASTGIVVSSVLPGAVLCEGGYWDRVVQDDPLRADRYLAEELPQRRFTGAEEIADLVAFLCSNRSTACVGSAFRADGGLGRSF